MTQLVINILLSTSLYILLGIAFVIIYQVIKFINMTFSVTITLSAHITYLFYIQFKSPFWVAFIIAILSVIIINVLCDWILFHPLKKRNVTSWKLLIVSLGFATIIQNLVSIVWGDDTKSLRTWSVKAGNEIFGAYITNVQLITIIFCFVLFLFSLIFLYSTSLGKKIRAVASNEELSNILGISSKRVILWSYVISSALAGITGILIALDTGMTPTMGFNILLSAIVVMIISGIGSYSGLFGGALLLAASQHLSAYLIDSKWMDATTYIFLIIFLIWKPFGFSGKYMKKIGI